MAPYFYIMNMRKITSILALLVLALVACHPEPEPIQPTPENPDFEITINGTTRGSVTFSVEPKDMDAPYLCTVCSKTEYEEFTREDFFVETIFQELREEASNVGKTLEEYMPEVVDRGAITEAKFSGLAAHTDYYIVVFGVDETDGL